VSTGIEGLDDVLGGGLHPDRLFLIEGSPGSGKTTLALQYLLECSQRGEPVLYVTLSETREELLAVAESHGWSLDGIQIHDLLPSAKGLTPDEQYVMFHPSEVELSETTQQILAELERVQPRHLVIDSLSEIRLLAGTTLRYRRQILALKQFFAGRHCTTLLLDDRTVDDDLQVRSIAHAVIALEHVLPEYGGDRRRLRVVKYRGMQFRGGHHDYKIRHGGIDVYPRLVAAEHRQLTSHPRLSSGIRELDELLGGGIDRGGSTLIVGAAGTGKSSLVAQFVGTATAGGERAAMFIFDEGPETLLNRAESFGIPLRTHLDAGAVSIQQVDPAELSPGELVHSIQQAVVRDKVAIVVIDSLNGYLAAMPEERHLIAQLHELLAFLGQAGVATILVGAHHGLLGDRMEAPVDASYLADSVILLRYFEAFGEIRQVISVVKKRGGPHQRTLREFQLGRGGIRIGAALHDFRGVLTGVPEYEGIRPPRDPQ
jgi:circadian clock protein KaiC